MKLRKIIKQFDCISFHDVIIYNSKSEIPILACDFCTLSAVADNDEQYRKDLLDDEAYTDIMLYDRALLLLDRKLYKGLENNTCSISVRTYTNDKSVAVSDLHICIE